MWRNQEMNVVRHHHERMHSIAAKILAISDGLKYYLRDFNLLQKRWPDLGCIEKPVHGDEGLTATKASGWKNPVRQKTIVKAKSYE